MAIELLCRKLGMTRVYAENGESIGVTVLEAGPNSVVQKKTPERDGYAALQLGFGSRRPVRTSKPLAGHFQKAGVAPTRYLAESRVGEEELEQHEVGGEIRVDIFEKGQRVDVIGTSRGRGTTGVVKRYGFKIHKMSHGTHEAFRHGGAQSAGTYPGHIFRGKKMAGQYGNERVTVLGLRVEKVDAERNLLFIRGGIPGHRNGLVHVRPSGRA